MNLPVPGEGCGFMVSDKIYRHGTRAAIGDFPWITLLLTENSNFACSGALINEKYVLTSADCIKRNPVTTVRLGEYNLNTTNDCYRYGITMECSDPVQEIPIEDVKIHEKADIALLRLTKSVKKSIFVRPICLPSQNEDKNIDEGKLFSIAGWKNGDFVEKQTTEIRGVNSNECNGTREFICVKGEEDVIDDGGALMATHNDGKGNNYYYAAGILKNEWLESDGKKFKKEFTRISNYVDWIQDNLVE
ncbi:CLIP domain-containing serine protease HP8-like [Culicoides brevitarsis]|uniref:CLIP domain-containing serine protease HP8-like n=1 Tax=Culicoides brevitarsis TaxID=469753 RepID=UPI00307B9CAB